MENTDRAVLRAGERVLLTDSKDRQYLIDLTTDQHFHTHAGILAHNDVIGRPEGCFVKSTTERTFLVLRPTLSDVVLRMPRGAQVIYPKDLGAILMQADIGPGQRVFESGVGSGALSMSLLRVGAQITAYEIREDFAANAKKNVLHALGSLDNYDVHIRDAYEGIDQTNFDRILLDLPEPWRVVPHAQHSLRGGGIFLSYVPSITQAQSVTEALRSHRFVMDETVEILRRTWHIDGRSVRPDHRMVAHTGFLVTARKLAEEN